MTLFVEIKKVILSIITALDILYYTDNLDFESKKKYEKKIWWDLDSNEEIEKRVQKIVDEFKLNLEKFYKDNLTKWKKLK